MKKALITGASGGIGLEIARQLSPYYSLTLVARSAETLKTVAAGLEGTGHQTLTADLSDPAGIQALATHITANPYDLLVNNAGVGIYGSFGDIDLAQEMAMLRLNIDAVVALSYAFLSKAKRGDALINLGSVLGNTSYSGASTYAGTKGFVIRFSESLWNEYRKKGIYVTAFCPGVTSSDFHKNAGGATENFPSVIQQTPTQVATQLRKVLRQRRKPHTVSGAINRIMLFFYRFLPRKIIVMTMGSFAAE